MDPVRAASAAARFSYPLSFMSTTTTSSATQAPAIDGVEDITRLEEEQERRVQKTKLELQQKEQETNQTYERERDAAVADKRTEAEAELVRFKEEELSRILATAQTASVDDCARLEKNAATHTAELSQRLLQHVANGEVFTLAV